MRSRETGAPLKGLLIFLGLVGLLGLTALAWLGWRRPVFRYHSALAEQRFAHFLKHSPHRGWEKAMTSLHRVGVYSFSRPPRAGSPVLVECAAWSFLWDKSPLLSEADPREFVVFFHVPLAPHPFDGTCDLTPVLRSRAFRLASSRCRAALCTSEYLRSQIEPFVPRAHVVYHPIEARGVTRFQWNFARDRVVVQVGDFLRRYASIVQLRVPQHWRKVVLSARSREETVEKLRVDCARNSVEWDPDAVEVWARVDDRAYDKLLAAHVVFLDLYDASANNAVLECAVRATPLLVNKHPAVVEYLGANYPLFYTSLEEASEMLGDTSRLEAGHAYLRGVWDSKRFSLENFVRTTSDLV